MTYLRQLRKQHRREMWENRIDGLNQFFTIAIDDARDFLNYYNSRYPLSSQPTSPNPYGNGRASVIHELYLWADRQIHQCSRAKHNQDNTHNRASISGQIKAYTRTKQQLEKKLIRMKKHQS